MMNNKLSALSALLLLGAAAIVSAQETVTASETIVVAPPPPVTVTGAAATATGDNIHVSIGISINVYTTTMNSLCPTGIVPVPYTISQHCPYGGACTQPPIPYGWQVTTRTCTVCGPTPTPVVLTECPFATPEATPPLPCDVCHKDIIVCPQQPAGCDTCQPALATYTHVYPPPIAPTPYAVPVTPACETCNALPPSAPSPYIAPAPVSPAEECPTCGPAATVVVSCPTCKPITPLTSTVIANCPTCALTVTVEAPCPTNTPVIVETVTPVCPGPYCPKTVTKTIPYSGPIPHVTPAVVCPGGPGCPGTSPVCPGGYGCPVTAPVCPGPECVKPYNNSTYPASSPVYTGGSAPHMKNAAAGLMSLAMAVIAALL